MEVMARGAPLLGQQVAANGDDSLPLEIPARETLAPRSDATLLDRRVLRPKGLRGADPGESRANALSAMPATATCPGTLALTCAPAMWLSLVPSGEGGLASLAADRRNDPLAVPEELS